MAPYRPDVCWRWRPDNEIPGRCRIVTHVLDSIQGNSYPSKIGERGDVLIKCLGEREREKEEKRGVQWSDPDRMRVDYKPPVLYSSTSAFGWNV